MTAKTQSSLSFFMAVGLPLPTLLGCAPDMADQPRYEPLEASAFFSDGMSARPRVPGTIARGELQLDDHFYQGQVDGQPAYTMPVEVDKALLRRGQLRYNIFCANCHDRVGTGRGMVVQRGFPQPPSYHTDRLRGVPVGYLFDVITNGFGRMPEHGSLISPEDRWAIVAYVRTLQLSQYASSSVLSNEQRTELQETQP